MRRTLLWSLSLVLAIGVVAADAQAGRGKGRGGKKKGSPQASGQASRKAPPHERRSKPSTELGRREERSTPAESSGGSLFAPWRFFFGPSDRNSGPSERSTAPHRSTSRYSTGPESPPIRPATKDDKPSKGPGPKTPTDRKSERETSASSGPGAERKSVASWERSRQERMPKRVVDTPAGFGIEKFDVRVAVLGRGSTMAGPFELPRHAREFGALVAENGWPLATGGGRGLPREAEKAAHEKGGETWAISGASTADEQLSALGDLRSTTVLYPTGTGSGAGTIEREAPLVQVANVRAYFNGSAGTFGELIAGLHEPGVIALHEKSKGVAGSAKDVILPHVGVPDHVRVVTADGPEGLLRSAKRALEELEGSGVSTIPTKLFQPRPHREVLSYEQRRGKHVFAFLTNDGGRSTDSDRGKAHELVGRALAESMDGKEPIAVFAEAGLSQRLALQAVKDHGRDTVVVSHKSGNDVRLRPKGKQNTLRIHRTGKGAGVGKFASHRGLVEHADVVFITSAYFENLSGLAFALRQSKKSTIAVLELPSTGSAELQNILRVVRDGSLSDRFVFSGSPERLVEKVKKQLEPPSWSSSKGSGSFLRGDKGGFGKDSYRKDGNSSGGFVELD